MLAVVGRVERKASGVSIDGEVESFFVLRECSRIPMVGGSTFKCEGQVGEGRIIDRCMNFLGYLPRLLTCAWVLRGGSNVSQIFFLRTKNNWNLFITLFGFNSLSFKKKTSIVDSCSLLIMILFLKAPTIFEIREFLRIGYAMITANTQLKIHSLQ